MIFSNEFGVAWMSDVVLEGSRIKHNYILGPVFLDDYSVEKIHQKLNKMQVSVPVKCHFFDVLKEFPVINLQRFFEYGIMLHRCITGETITQKDFVYPQLLEKLQDDFQRTRPGLYMAENEIVRMVEEGNLNYGELMNKYLSFGEIGNLADKDYLRECKNLVIILAVLCARAAIKGGIAPEISYQLRENYIRLVESAQSLGNVVKVSHAILGDYVKRVHAARTIYGTLSPKIKQACDYICIHLKDELNISDLAEMLGYSDYYFSRKFKQETGQNVRDYINLQKIELAKEMITGTAMEIQEIYNMMGYSSHSYFNRVFKSATGMTPLEYREHYSNEKEGT